MFERIRPYLTHAVLAVVWLAGLYTTADVLDYILQLPSLVSGPVFDFSPFIKVVAILVAMGFLLLILLARPDEKDSTTSGKNGNKRITT